MWKAIRAAVVGVIIGLFCGVLYVELGALKRIYNARTDMEQLVSLVEETEKTGDGEAVETAFQVLDQSSGENNNLETTLKNMEAYYDAILETGLEETELEKTGLEEAGLEKTGLKETGKASKNTNTAEDVIRIIVEYGGEERLSDKQKNYFEEYVKNAVLYGVSEKLGEQYNSQDKAVVRKNLILSLEYINDCAEEGAEEYGIPAEVYSRFEYLYLPETTFGNQVYPAGYYETLCITLD